MTVANLIMPSGNLSAGWTRVADESKFRFRTSSKNAILELAGINSYSDDYSTDPINTIATNRLLAVKVPNISISNTTAAGGSIVAIEYSGGKLNFLNSGTFANYEPFIYHKLAKVKNGSFVAKIKINTAYNRAPIGVVARCDGGELKGGVGNFYAFMFYDPNSANGFKIVKVVNQTMTTLHEISAVGYDYTDEYYLRFLVSDNILKGKFWVVGTSEPTTGGPDNDGYQLKATDTDITDAGYFGFHSGGVYATSNYIYGFTSNVGGYSATSPVYYTRNDAGIPGAVWTGGNYSVKTNVSATDTGLIYVKEYYSDTLYSQGDENTLDALATGSWLVPDANGVVTFVGGTGRHRYLLYQFISDGTKQTSLACYDNGGAVLTEVFAPTGVIATIPMPNRLSDAWCRVADSSKFRFRTGTKNSILELNPEYGTGFTDNYDTDPFAVGGRLTKITYSVAGGWTWVTPANYIDDLIGTETVGVAYYNGVAYQNISDGTWQAKIRANEAGALGYGGGILLRFNPTTGVGYFFGINYTSFAIGKVANSIMTNLATLAGVSIDVDYQIKVYASGTSLKLKKWVDGGAEPIGWDIEITDASYSSGSFGVTVRGAGGSTRYLRVDDYYYIGGYASTSPIYYSRNDATYDDASWQSGTYYIKTNVASTDTGEIQVKECYSNTLYGVGDEDAIDALSGIYQTPDPTTGAVTFLGGIGRYRYLLFKFISDGTQQTSLLCWDATGNLLLDIGGGGVSRPRLRLDNILGR